MDLALIWMEVLSKQINRWILTSVDRDEVNTLTPAAVPTPACVVYISLTGRMPHTCIRDIRGNCTGRMQGRIQDIFNRGVVSRAQETTPFNYQ